jgi:hypothetical protein
VQSVSTTILTTPTASPVTCWQIGGTKEEKETPHAFISLSVSVAPILTDSSTQLLPCHDRSSLPTKAKSKEAVG